MGLLTEPGLDEVVAAGCACGGKRLLFRAYLDAAFPLLGGDPVGPPTWVYDGEKFVDGVYEITCEACAKVLFAAEVCPRCHAAGGLAKALAAGNGHRPPDACPACGDDEVRLTAFVPAKVAYEGKRAEKPRTTTGLFDPGFHAVSAACRDCGPIASPPGATDGACPLCDAPGPLRARP